MSQESSTSVCLPRALTAETAASLVDMLLAATQEMHGVVVDLDMSNVENMTCPGLQVLLALQKTMQADGGDVRFVGSTPLAVQVIHDLGVQIPSIAPAGRA